MRFVRYAAFAVFVLSLLSACGQAVKKDKKEVHEMTVKVHTVSEKENPEVKSYVGVVSPAKSAFLSCRYPGKLMRLSVSRGDVVKKGDVVAVIESQSVISSREMAYATLKQAEDGYARVSQVHKSGSVADVKLIEIETKLSQARTAAKTADKALEDCTVKAPFDGVISDVLADEGIELSGMDNIVRIMDISEVEIHFPVPESELGAVSVGSSMSVTIPALGQEDLPAKVTSKGITASPLSHTYDCILKPQKKISGLMPGMVCKVYSLNEGACGFVIPAAVVRTDTKGRYVWVVRDGIVVKTPVVIGGFSGSGVIVTDGLQDGDKVITEGGQKVCSGMKVLTTE